MCNCLDDLKTWLNGPGDWDAGVILVNKYIHNPALVQAFQEAPTPYKEKRMRMELSAILEAAATPPPLPHQVGGHFFPFNPAIIGQGKQEGHQDGQDRPGHQYPQNDTEGQETPPEALKQRIPAAGAGGLTQRVFFVPAASLDHRPTRWHQEFTVPAHEWETPPAPGAGDHTADAVRWAIGQHMAPIGTARPHSVTMQSAPPPGATDHARAPLMPPPMKCPSLEPPIAFGFIRSIQVRPAPPAPPVATVQKGWGHREQMDPVVLALWNQWKPLFSEMNGLQSRLHDVALKGQTDPAAKQEAHQMAKRILSLDRQCDDLYFKRDTYRTTGTLPTDKRKADDLETDPKKWPTALANAQRYVREYRKKAKDEPTNENTAQQLQKWIDRVEHYKTKLNS
jgi:hypothetical protein